MNDPRDIPVAGAEIIIAGSSGFVSWRGHTDAQGIFEAVDLPNGPLTCKILKEGYFHENYGLPFPTPAQITLTLHEDSLVFGMVTDALTHRPIPSFEARLFADDIPKRFTSGHYEFPLLGFGKSQQIRLDAPGYLTGLCAPIMPGTKGKVRRDVELRRSHAGGT